MVTLNVILSIQFFQGLVRLILKFAVFDCNQAIVIGVILKQKAWGGHYHWKVVQGCAVVMTPFFQAKRCSLAYQFTINAPLMCPRFQFSIYRKISIYSLVFLRPKFQLSRCKISEFFAPKTLQFSRKTHSLDPTFVNLHSTYPPKIVKCPPWAKGCTLKMVL